MLLRFFLPARTRNILSFHSKLVRKLSLEKKHQKIICSQHSFALHKLVFSVGYCVVCLPLKCVKFIRRRRRSRRISCAALLEDFTYSACP